MKRDAASLLMVRNGADGLPERRQHRIQIGPAVRLAHGRVRAGCSFAGHRPN